eukprot:3227431-Heterocapsa_arctica.AAC.1
MVPHHLSSVGGGGRRYPAQKDPAEKLPAQNDLHPEIAGRTSLDQGHSQCGSSDPLPEASVNDFGVL